MIATAHDGAKNFDIIYSIIADPSTTVNFRVSAYKKTEKSDTLGNGFPEGAAYEGLEK
jgi:hypothetical protein